MAFRDLREFIAALEAEREIVRMQHEVDWNLEVGAIARRANEANLPAALFERIRGYPAGYRIFSEALSNHRRIAVALGLPADTPVKKLIDVYLERKKKPIAPVLVPTGPCKENIRTGEEVDLTRFPVPFIHDCDGGRFIGSWHLTICKDLDSGWVNWGMYRHMLHDRNHIGILAGPQLSDGIAELIVEDDVVVALVDVLKDVGQRSDRRREPGLGMQLAEQLSLRYSGRAEGAIFTNPNKELWAVEYKVRMQRKELPIPLDRDLSYQIHSIKKKYTADKHAGSLFDALDTV